MEPEQVFGLIADVALELAHADAGHGGAAFRLLTPNSEAPDLVVAATAGVSPEPEAIAPITLADSIIGTVFATRTPCRVAAIEEAARPIGESGPAMVVPLRTTDTVAGVLVAVRHAGAPGVHLRTADHDGLHSPTRRRWPGNWPTPSTGFASWT